MDETEASPSKTSTAVVSAFTTAHLVLQPPASTTYTEAAARSSHYVMGLSSSLSPH